MFYLAHGHHSTARAEVIAYAELFVVDNKNVCCAFTASRQSRQVCQPTETSNQCYLLVASGLLCLSLQVQYGRCFFECGPIVRVQACHQVCCRGEQGCQSSFVAMHGLPLCRVCILLTAEVLKLTSWAGCGLAAHRRAPRLSSEAFFAACIQHLQAATSCPQDGQHSIQEALSPWAWGKKAQHRPPGFWRVELSEVRLS